MRCIICLTCFTSPSQASSLMYPERVDGNSRPVFKCSLLDGAVWEPSTVPLKLGQVYFTNNWQFT